ncbi:MULTISPECIES: SPFH domain-containing protein [Chryseobacterium]|uniref:Regulator of protease activity HflC (Stomatin/prohibitin superfamily) n=1 Tax=Chryseobacterium camelliae TaxID=1265445 RepID=A0ABU0TGI3_9FLAO|nr:MULTISPECIES: SPFH domain-containing protein [Chryseobacterium]MDT3406048.1 regulator of protease activity HflC (stomatin/prohibitin superfamily) [Pseudacidovorax intermedius]MDQ1096152.1 regulator of protease activity HflC (stomatin/prohibitin superfamily) [Chryseobacterium camelliae]MDQ1100088.1 regulator of protease activity HflC (stomatin/prohibitin superfamily) [Chryseobacterium sp. SORGH_AS_1048]MDR6087432.1 regulator of protease activity HflC (stomatin/prohibitin superfamily) [Chryseo
MEKSLKPMSGYLALVICLILFTVSLYLFILGTDGSITSVIIGFLCFFLSCFFLKGLMIIQPNHSRILNFFGKYVGTVKENGLFFINPLYSSQKMSLRSENMQGQTLKVNDKMGNPIEIAAVIVWKVGNTYKAAYEVERYTDYVKMQSEAAVRHLAVSFPYDNLEDEHANITLRDGGDQVNKILEQELTDRLAPAGIIIQEARITHLAYASEIAGAMLQRQQATAIVAARTKIVEGAVGMVDLALKKLSEENIVELDDERKAAMVSNLMVVLCGEKAATPILNAGTLYN